DYYCYSTESSNNHGFF
nr:immunoglobulin light chain junction region [Macaca mulatta]MOX20375.1 immunoglobulin light chain junction region [Macaca mulatta]MOX21215.1 immunoglobulin light chain junction region [Macaca mulatta]MOX21965.1 immunoglobulin light chain junction region [Macaca mulatta]